MIIFRFPWSQIMIHYGFPINKKFEGSCPPSDPNLLFVIVSIFFNHPETCYSYKWKYKKWRAMLIKYARNLLFVDYLLFILNLDTPSQEAKLWFVFQVSVRIRDNSDHKVMSIESLLKHFSDEVAAFHWVVACKSVEARSTAIILLYLYACVHYFSNQY